MRVLLVEDDRMLGDGVQAGLGAAGFTVDWVRDGESALAALASEAFAAVLLDLGLPRRDGLSVLAELRRVGNGVPVMILTARDQIADKVRGLDLGADDYLV
ncbi:MAG TPA: response regulator, partial [Zoogloea sp.]|nr:response regulator [Zoogloea sp.]